MERAIGGRAGRSGLTLLELVVVLTILVAVSGLIIPILGNFTHRANVASCTVNITEMDKIIQSFHALYAQYPDRFDNVANAIYNGSNTGYVLDGSQGDYKTASFVPQNLSSDDAKALVNAGITQLMTIQPNAMYKQGEWTPTAWPYGTDMLDNTGQPVVIPSNPVAAGLNVAYLTEFGKRLMGVPEGSHNQYVIFGLNKPCTLFRNMVSEPPYHFADTPTEDPATWYMCFAAVFMVERDYNGVQLPMEEARFMGSIAFHDFGLATADSHNKEWWERLKEERPLSSNS